MIDLAVHFRNDGVVPRPYTIEERGFLHAWVAAWRRAAEMQAERVSRARVFEDQGVEADLFLLAVRNLVRACEVFSDDHRVASAVSDFERAAPGIKDARDLLEHFDEYDRGVGRLQKEGRMRDLSLVLFYEDTGAAQSIRIGPHTINVTTTFQAADELAFQVLAIASANPAE